MDGFWDRGNPGTWSALSAPWFTNGWQFHYVTSHIIWESQTHESQQAKIWTGICIQYLMIIDYLLLRNFLASDWAKYLFLNSIKQQKYLWHFCLEKWCLMVGIWAHFVPTTEGKGRYIAFGADPVGVGVRVVSCLHAVFWTNGWILSKLAQTH